MRSDIGKFNLKIFHVGFVSKAVNTILGYKRGRLVNWIKLTQIVQVSDVSQ
jgi:hypothetical protein